MQFELAVSSQTIRLGLNFPTPVPDVQKISTYMDKVKDSGAQIFRQMGFADVIWSQVEPTDNEWVFTRPDSIFNGYSQFQYVANLFSFDIVNNIGYQVPWRACTGSSSCGWNAFLDSASTRDYVTKCVQLYGSTVKYWELGNESENSTYPKGMPAIDFFNFVKYNYRWIKAANSSAKVMLPGTVGTYNLPFTTKYQWYRTIFSLGIGSYFDVFSFHDYNAWWATPVHIDSIIAIKSKYGLTSKELWITESSVSSQNAAISPSYISVDEQAADVWRRPAIAWAKGVSTFIWHGCWSNSMPSDWAEFGILDFSGKKKKAYHSYKLIETTIRSFSSAEVTSIGTAVDDNSSATGGNGAWVMKFVVGGKNKYVMWSRNSVTFQLTPVLNTKYRITNVVPGSLSPDGEIAVFTRDSVNVTGGQSHTFQLGSLPILVEELPGTATSVPGDKVMSAGCKLYPNPASTVLTIENLTSEIARYNVYNVAGKLVASIIVPADGRENVSTGTWENGFYIVRPGNGGKAARIIINK